MVAAIAGWLYEVWPANPVTFAVAAVLVAGGPILGIIHVATSGDDAEPEPEPATPAPRVVLLPAPEPVRLTEKAEAARRFASWRDTPNDAITQRERARRANRYVRG
jgi:hypothetical protein